MPADPGAARDTAMLGDTTGAMDDTAMTQMGDTVTTQVDDPAATQTGDTAPAQMSDTTGAADDPTGTMSDSAMMQMGDTATRGRQVEIGTIIACGLLTGASTSSRPLADCVVRPHIQRMIRHGAIVQFYFSGFWGIPAGGRRLVHTRR